MDDVDDDDDEFPFVSSPNNFLLSTYKENLPVNNHETNLNEHCKTSLSYKCDLCCKNRDNPILTCSICVNTGQFYSSKHERYSNKKRDLLLNMLNKNDYEEFQQHSDNKSKHLLYSDRMFLLKKFHLQKNILQFQIETTTKSAIEIHQMSESIQTRKNRLHRINHSIKTLREQIDRKKQLNVKTVQRSNEIRLRIESIKIELNDINKSVQSANKEIERKIYTLTRQGHKLNIIRRECFDDLYEHIFPIEQITTIEEDLAIRIQDLLSAQQTTMDEINYARVDNDEILNVIDYKYKIVNSCLASNGDYQIENLVVPANITTNGNGPDSPHSSFSYDLYEVLSALSHACQLINTIAFLLHIHLPFRLHQLEFNTDNLILDCVRADIAKLNANIITCCLSQGIPIEFTNVTYTLENLLKLLQLEKYPNRPKPVIYSQNYIDMIERDVNEVSRASVTDYWFDDNDDDDEKNNAIDPLNNYEWEEIPQSGYIPDDPSVSDHSDSLPSSSTEQQQHSSVMNSSIGYLKTKSSVIFDSLIRNFKS